MNEEKWFCFVFWCSLILDLVTLVDRNPLSVNHDVPKLRMFHTKLFKILCILNTCTEVLSTKRYYIIPQLPALVKDHDLSGRSKTGIRGERWERETAGGRGVEGVLPVICH